ncbi:hypothetical protein P0D71_31560, partial [Paraburkholderia sp. RL17-383-BIF-A]
MGSRPRFIDDLSRAASDAPGPETLNPLADDALLDAYSRTVIGALERVQQAVAFISVERRLPGDPSSRGPPPPPRRPPAPAPPPPR